MVLLNATPKLWTRAEYESLADSGALSGVKTELIEGTIVEMPPQRPPHSRSITHGNNKLVQLFGATHYIRVQLPLDLLERSQPEPDFALVPFALVDGPDVEGHPTAADLVIEISHTSLPYDRAEKASLYARAGIPEYWLVNLVSHQVEVYRQPGPSAEGLLGYAYRSTQLLSPEQTVRPLFAPDVAVPLSYFF